MLSITRVHEIRGSSSGPGRGGSPVAPVGAGVPDMDLMLQVRAGSASAFDVIVERHWAATVRYAHHLVRDRDQASDIAQEAFTRLWQRRDEWEPRGSVLIWLLRTSRRLVVTEARRQAVRARWAEGEGRESAHLPPTPLQDLERAELRDAIQLALQALSPRRCEAFTLFHVQNLTYREIAEVMEIRPQTVANYLQAAIADLRHALAPFLLSQSGTEHFGR